MRIIVSVSNVYHVGHDQNANLPNVARNNSIEGVAQQRDSQTREFLSFSPRERRKKREKEREREREREREIARAE